MIDVCTNHILHSSRCRCGHTNWMHYHDIANNKVLFSIRENTTKLIETWIHCMLNRVDNDRYRGTHCELLIEFRLRIAVFWQMILAEWINHIFKRKDSFFFSCVGITYVLPVQCGPSWNLLFILQFASHRVFSVHNRQLNLLFSKCETVPISLIPN